MDGHNENEQLCEPRSMTKTFLTAGIAARSWQQGQHMLNPILIVPLVVLLVPVCVTLVRP
jgi:hypothetical protein